MERIREVRVFKRQLMCDNDCTGEMLPTSPMLLSNPPQYSHVCDVCGASTNVRGKKYPYLEYKEID